MAMRCPQKLQLAQVRKLLTRFPMMVHSVWPRFGLLGLHGLADLRALGWRQQAVAIDRRA